MRSEQFITVFLAGLIVGMSIMGFTYQFKKDMVSQYLDTHPNYLNEQGDTK